MASYAQGNCAGLVSNLRANTRAFLSEMEKLRSERAAIQRETLRLLNEEMTELAKDLQEFNRKIGYQPPPVAVPTPEATPMPVKTQSATNPAPGAFPVVPVVVGKLAKGPELKTTLNYEDFMDESDD